MSDKKLSVLVCECGKQYEPKEKVWAAFHRHGDDLKPYEEVEVIPVEQLAKVEAERDEWHQTARREREALRSLRGEYDGFRERLMEKALDEPAITAAESSYKAMLPAANDPWDDTGWAEPMTEAVQAAIRHALDQLADEAEEADERAPLTALTKSPRRGAAI